MPARSKAQFNFMEGIAHGSIPARGSLTPAKAKEFVQGQTPKALPKRASAASPKARPARTPRASRK